MRTTVDLPPALHRRARELAAQSGRSLSTVISDLTARGLAQLDEPLEISVDEETGIPTVSIGRRITQAQVAAMLDED